MALDSQLTQNINLRANGDALLRPLTAMGNQLNRLVQQMQQVANPSTAKGRKELQDLTSQAQKAIGTLRTINDLIDGGSRSGRAKNRLLSGLDEQSLGKSVLNASKLKVELEQTTKASEALGVRIAQLQKKFAELGNAGKAIGQRDIAKALNTQEALRQVTQLERQIGQLNARNSARGGTSSELAALQAQVGAAQANLLGRAQNGRRVDFSKEIGELSLLVDGYAKLTRAEEASATVAQRAAAKRLASIQDTINMNEAQLRSSINRGASGYSYTPGQARTFDIKALNAEVEQGTARLQRYQEVMDRALAAGKVRTVDMLAQGFSNLKTRVEEASGQIKAFESLPEQKMKSMTSMLFAGGGGAFAKRIVGAGAISYAGFTALNSVISSAKYVADLDDAMAKLQAISGATDPEMQRLSKSIFDVAQNSRYSTLEITQAATQIAQAGYAADDASKVLQSSLVLATGSGSSISEAVDAMTSALGAFNLQASESGRIMDVLMTALNDSKLSMTQMQAAIQYAGATAHEAGMSIEELSVFAEMAANAGIKSGSTIGTGMRQLIIDLQEPTEKFKKQLDALGLTMADVDVKSQGLDGVIRKLTTSGFTAEAAYSSFETRAAAFYLALKGQMDTYDQLSQSISQTGAAAAAQERAMGSLSAQWQKFLNLLTQITVGLAGPFMVAMKGALEIVNALAGALVSFASSTTASDASGQALAGTFDVLIGMLTGFFVGGPWGAVIGGLASFVGVMNEASDSTEAFEAKTNDAKSKLTAQKQTISSVDEAINRLVTRHDALKDHSVALQVETQTLTQRFEGLSTELKGAALNYDNLLSAMLRYRGAQLRDAAVKADATRLAAQQQGGAAVGGIYANNVALQGMFANGATHPRQSVADVMRYVQGTVGANVSRYGSMNTEDLLGETTEIRAMLIALQREKDQNGTIKQIEGLLQQRLNLLESVKKARSDITSAERDIGLYNEQTNQAGKIRDSYVMDATKGINNGLSENKAKAGSGELDLTKTINLAKARIDNLTKQLASLDPSSAKALAIQNSIDQLNAQVARVASAAALDSDGKGAHAKPGQTLTAAQVKAELIKAFPGIKIGSADIRKPGDPAYTKGTLHSMGRALDIQGLPEGVTADNILAFIESLGLTIAPGHNGYWDERQRPATAKTWTGPHLHVGWEAKMSQSARAGARADTKEENETQRLIEEGDRLVLDTINKNIQTTLDDAKNGTKAPADLAANLDQQIADYQAAALKQYDDANPVKDLTDAQKKIWEANREKVKADVAAKAADWHAKLWKQIEDTVEKLLDATLASLKAATDTANYNAEGGIRSQQQRLDTMGNRYNRNQFGAGTLYRENQKLEDAQLQANQSKVNWNQGVLLPGLKGIVDRQQANVNSLDPNSEAATDAKKKLLDYQNEYNQALRDTTALQAAIDTQTQHLADIPLGDRLRDAANAWREQNGAMDSWAKRLEDGVGPALDNLTSGLGDMFSALMDGSKNWKQALGDMLKSFAEFVIQYIAKCLAMLAINAIMKALGVPVPAAFNGGKVAPAKGAFNGGPVEVPGRLGGGISHLPGGGSVRNGFTTHDSALYNLAAGEYVVRNKSVKSLGIPFMDMINKHGAQGLAAMQGVQQNIVQPSHQEVNVWMVKEGTKPPISKRDIVLAISDDILQGGQTKQLIQKVQNGG